MKKIICTVTNDLTHDQRMIRICTSLSKAGFDVLLVGRVLKNSTPLFVMPFGQKRLKLFFTTGKPFYIEYNLRLFAFLLFSRFDIVNSIDLDTLVPGYLAAIIKKKACVYDAHEYFTEVPEVVDRPVVKKIWEAIAALIVPKLNHCYTVAEGLATVLTKKYGPQFAVILNVPLEKAHVFYKKAQSPFIILYQGVLNEGRGLEEAIEAVVYLEDTELWIAGEGDRSIQLRQLVKKLGLSEKVRFLGKLKPDELASITPKAHLGLNLLQNKGLNYYYSLANKAFDYIQAGIPSLNMAFPEYVRINERYRVFVLLDKLDPLPIVAVIKAIRTDQQAYQRLVENCKQAASEYTWENEEMKLIEFYKNVVTTA